MKKKKVLIIIIISLLLILSIVGISYALWTLNLTQTGENDIATTCFNISFTEKDNISLQKSYPLYDADGKKLTPYEFTITNNCDSYASFSVNLEVLNTTTLTNNDAIKVMFSKKEDNTESELKLDLLSNYEVVSKTLNNATTAFKLTDGYLDAKGSRTYDLRIWLDENVTTETVNIQNTTFNSKVVVTASYVKEIPFATNVISKLAKDADSSSTDVYTVPNKTSDTCTYTLAYDGTSDNNLRYVGANPCNYVKVDDEYWRIIGVMNNIDDGTGKKESRIKLVTDEVITESSWDTSDSSINSGYGVNEWSQADVMKLLNPGYESETVGGSLYYNNQSGICYRGKNNQTIPCDFKITGMKDTIKKFIDEVLWNTGAPSSMNSAKILYNAERSNINGKTCLFSDHCNDNVERTTSWIGKVGLMYPSDYGYATLHRECTNYNLRDWYQYVSCPHDNWISNSGMTISPFSFQGASELYPGYATSFFIIFDNMLDTTATYDNASTYNNIKPTVYLKTKTLILNGEGTKEEPYELSL